MFWLLTLPIRMAFWLVFGILFLPFLLLRFFLKLTLGLLLLPFVLLVLFFVAIVGGLALALAFAPILLGIALIWLLVRLAQPATHRAVI